jgi:hypothetical protein
VSSLYINKGRAAGVRHRVFRVDLGLLYPYLVGAALSGALSRRLGSGSQSFSFLYPIQQQCSAILPVYGSRHVTDNDKYCG